MAIYIDVPVREDRLAEVFELLSIEPLDRAADSTQGRDKQDLADSVALGEAHDDARDDARWDAFWAVHDNVREHLAPRSDFAHAITRAIAEHAEDGVWINGDGIAADIGASPSSVASALGPVARYLGKRDLAWPFRWRYGMDDRIEYLMAPQVAAVVLDIL
jgi:hypothetical protein